LRQQVQLNKQMTPRENGIAEGMQFGEPFWTDKAIQYDC
jgi:hypothetical protein